MDLQIIKEKYNIDDDNLSIIRDKLRKIMIGVHPDRNGGDFKDANNKKEFLELSEAIKYIDEFNGSSELSLIDRQNELIRQQAELIRQQSEMQVSKNSYKDKENTKILLKKEIDTTIIRIKDSSRTQNISFGAFWTFMTGLFFFPEKVIEHPILGKLVNQNFDFFSNLWFALIVGSVGLFMYIKRQEMIKINSIKCLESDDFQNYVYMHFFRYKKSYYGEEKEDKIFFSKRDLVSHLIDEFRHGDRYNIINGYIRIKISRVPMEIYNKIADVIIEKALEKKLIEKCESRMLEDEYTFLDIISEDERNNK